MLKQRLITAIILIALTLAALRFLPPPAFCILLGGVTLAAAWEWSNLMELKRISHRVIYLLIMLLALFNSLFVPIQLILTIAFVWWSFSLFLIISYPKGSQIWGKSTLLRGLMGIFVLLPCWVAINYIRNQNDGIFAIVILFVLIWGADSVAYFVGRKWGKHKLAPDVSPGKSVEGFIGALVFSVVIISIALACMHIPLAGWPWAIGIALTTVTFSVVGDLFESMLKRQAGLKDSGKLLPGHGGLLDRIDSLTAAAPMFTLGSLLMTMYF